MKIYSNLNVLDTGGAREESSDKVQEEVRGPVSELMDTVHRLQDEFAEEQMSFFY